MVSNLFLKKKLRWINTLMQCCKHLVLVPVCYTTLASFHILYWYVKSKFSLFTAITESICLYRITCIALNVFWPSHSRWPFFAFARWWAHLFIFLPQQVASALKDPWLCMEWIQRETVLPPLWICQSVAMLANSFKMN